MLVHILSYKWTSAAPFPSMSKIARKMNCSTRYVRKLCESLESVGYLKRMERVGRSNEFDFSGLFAKLEECMAKARTVAGVPTAPPASSGALAEAA